ncbi:hypothetical protein [Massilia sp. NR 4-1]|uniref:hypothetical protein n=1 Tax=Massilia sp. NR 4-1 TaxID=1678028 RepID=UPI000A4CB969|nr:hypothetical protein [Massilia sp. NR 4-1]
MPFDTDKFAKHLRSNAANRSQARCATFVRKALEAGGADTTGHPAEAKRYGNLLIRNGFHSITVSQPDTYAFVKGDIVVMDPTANGNQAGHIAAYDGKNWISDFVQAGFWPGPAYVKERPKYVVYRR